MAIVIVGDAKEIIPQAQQYAESIDVFDTEGNVVDIPTQDAAAN